MPHFAAFSFFPIFCIFILNDDNMKILVTGADGQLGHCIRDAVESIKQTTKNEYFFRGHDGLDITDINSIKKVVDEIDPEIIINCAAYINTDEAEWGNRLTAYKVNAMGPTYLALECKERDIELIHISTEYVFDGESPVAYNENSECLPINIYGLSKFCGEEAVRTILGNNAIIIRTSWLYSQYGSNFLTKTLANIRKAKEEGRELHYVIDQVGCPTYAANLAEFIVFDLIEERKGATIRPRSTYHYTDNGIASRYDFAKAIEEEVYNRGEEDNFGSVIQATTSDSFIDKIKRPKCCILSKEGLISDFNANIKDWRESLRECAKTFVKEEKIKKRD